MDAKFIPNSICAPIGFSASGIYSAVKKSAHKLDLAIIYSHSLATAAGVYTKNKLKAAPLKLCKKNLKNGQLQAIVINSGNANACTGPVGMQHAKQMASVTAQKLKLDPANVGVSSTGVIGVTLPIDKILNGIDKGVVALSRTGGEAAAKAIMTTDTFCKQVAISIKIGKTEVKIGGIAKGSGMIHPNMATMLSFITTDADISSDVLEYALKKASADSFNMISVDGDESTNDMALVMANGMAKNTPIKSIKDKGYTEFYAGLLTVCTNLAKQIVTDGEGATKIFEVNVKGAKTEKQAKIIARTVSSSSLVKAALFGNDANWGRIACAVGYSDTKVNLSKLTIKLDNMLLFTDGMPVDFDEDKALILLKQKNVIINIDLHVGKVKTTAWGCDLSYDYVKINADYRS